jgi:hypothetical protein
VLPADLVNLLNPSAVIFGGGVFRAAPQLLLDALKRPLKQRALEKLANEVQLKGSALGGEAGALGDRKTVVETLNRMMIGWANYFCLATMAVRQTQRAVAGDQEITNDLRRVPLSLLDKNSSRLAVTLVEPARAFRKSQAFVRAGRRRAIPFQREMVLSETRCTAIACTAAKPSGIGNCRFKSATDRFNNPK